MPTLQENLDRVKILEDFANKAKSELDKYEAKASLHKEQYEEQKEKLNERGLQFNTGSELNAMYQEKSRHLEELLDAFEQKAGIQPENNADSDFNF